MSTESAFVLDHATLWIGDGTAFSGHVVVRGDRIESVERGRYAGPLPVTDLGGAALSPGMIDLMVLGGFGKSIVRDDPLDIMRKYVRMGVTSAGVCCGTLPWDAMLRLNENVRRAKAYDRPDAARCLGIYLEGPFQHPDFTGASLREHALPPTPENVGRILEHFGDILTVINVSPGTEGDAAAVAAFRQAGVVVSMAHSNADVDRVLACVDAGASVLGHCWDNNSGRIGDSGVQQPTLEHVAFTDERVRFIHQICDGQHAHPVMIRLVLRCRGVESLCLVTDCVPRAGCPDGPYVWDDGRHFYKKGGVGRTDKHHLTGSALLLPDQFRNFVKFTGIAPAAAIRTVTYNPAVSIGLEGRIGLLASGRSADLVLWDDRLRVQRVWRSGQEITDVSAYGEIDVTSASRPLQESSNLR